jgi:hypothetical protein
MTKFKNRLNNFITHFILCASIVLALFVIINNLQFFFAYGAQERSLFFGHQFDISSNNGTSELPQIAIQGNNVYVVWQDNTNGNYDILFTYSSDNGTKFAPVRNLSNNNGTSELPQIATQGNNVYVVWQDNTNGNYDIFFKSSPSNGTKFKSLRNLSNNSGTSEFPQIAVSSTDAYIIWRDNETGIGRIFFKHGQKDNATDSLRFGPVNELHHSGEVSGAKIITGSEVFYGVWSAHLNKNNASTIELYPFMLFEDYSGDSIPLTSLSSNQSMSNPDIAVGNGDTYLVWENKTTGNGDIFFKRFSTHFFDRNE